jgi:hypothetical protein
MNKLLLLAFFILFSNLSFAYINDIECESRFSDQNYDFRINVIRPMSQGPWRQTEVQTFLKGQLIRTDFFHLTFFNNQGFNNIRFWGQGVDLEIDLWPDRVPQFGRYYSARFSNVTILSNKPFTNIDCRFPWAK